MELIVLVNIARKLDSARVLSHHYFHITTRQVIRTLKGYRGQGKERITNLSEYLKRFSDAVDYDYFRAIGLPIGSGEVESAHRYIPQKRLKILGATWHPDTLNPMLALRIIRANGWWDDFWSRRSYYQRINI